MSREWGKIGIVHNFFFRAYDVVGENSENSCGRKQSRSTGSWVGARGFRADPTPQTATFLRWLPSLPVPRFRLLRRLSSLLRLLRLFPVSYSLRLFDEEALGRQVRQVCLRLDQARKEGLLHRGSAGKVWTTSSSNSNMWASSLARAAATAAASAERSAGEDATAVDEDVMDWYEDDELRKPREEVVKVEETLRQKKAEEGELQCDALQSVKELVASQRIIEGKV